MVDIKISKPLTGETPDESSRNKIINENFANIKDSIEALSGESSTLKWENITNKPCSFTPSAHTQAISTINSLQSALDEKAAINGSSTQDFYSKDLYVSGDLTVGGGITANIFREVPYTGTIDGTNAIFYTNKVYSTLNVFLNGLRKNSSFYTYTGTRVVLNTPPASGSTLDFVAFDAGISVKGFSSGFSVGFG